MSDRETVSLTRQLVSIPSHDDETAAGEAIADWLQTETDAAVRTDEVGNVIARKTPDRTTDAALAGDEIDQPATGRPTLAFVGHHDVVPPAPEQLTDGGSCVVNQRDGRLYGRGTADMKGAVAAAMLAVRDTSRDQLAEAGLELVVASFVDEESGSLGCRTAIERGFQPAYAVVCEGSTGYSAPGVTDVAVAHKGRRGIRLTASGTAAHASEPAAGDNAIYRACTAVETVRSATPPASTIHGREIQGSLAVTEIDGGEAWNVIPEECGVSIDERTVPGDRLSLDRLTSIAGVSLDVQQDLPPMACDDPAFADAVLAAARAVHTDERPNDSHTGDDHTDERSGDEQSDDGHTGDERSGDDHTDDDQPQHVIKPHATDAGYLADAGTTTVVCGPAEPGEAHTDTESVGIDVLDRCRRLYREIITHAPPEDTTTD